MCVVLGPTMRVYVNPVLPVKSDGRRISVAHTQFRLVGVASVLAKRWVVLLQCVGAGVGRHGPLGATENRDLLI